MGGIWGRYGNVKQYCRYCNNLVTGNGIYCTRFEKEVAESTTKRPNACKGFEFNPMDAYAGETEHYYRPRKTKQELDNLRLADFV